MSLLTPTESVQARIAADAEQLARYVSSAIVLANRIASKPLSLPPDELTDWLAARPLDQRLAEFSAHADMGDALNDAASISEMATGKREGALGRVDIRSVADKLAARGLTVEIVDGSFVVGAAPAPQAIEA